MLSYQHYCDKTKNSLRLDRFADSWSPSIAVHGRANAAYTRSVQEPESTPAGVGVLQQEPEQDQKWIFSIGTGAGVNFNHSAFEIFMFLCTLRDL